MTAPAATQKVLQVRQSDGTHKRTAVAVTLDEYRAEERQRDRPKVAR